MNAAASTSSGYLRCRAVHRVGVGEVARLLVAVAVEDFDRAQVVLLTLGLRFREPRLRRGAEPLQNRARRGGVLFHPDGMGVRHRLAPVRHGEARIGLLRLAEELGRRPVLEVVELREAGEEILLRRGGAGVREADLANACHLRSCAPCDGQGQADRQQQQSKLGAHRCLWETATGTCPNHPTLPN